MGQERRQSERAIAVFPGYLQVEDGNATTTVVRDISVHGANLLTSEKLKQGQSVTLRLYLTGDHETSRVVEGNIVRVEGAGADSSWAYRVGVRFAEELSDCEEDIRILATKQAKLFRR